MNRDVGLGYFYDILDGLAARIGGPRCLNECDGRLGWPDRGVYFFFEPGEDRSTSGSGPRVVRLGTHAVSATSKTVLWGRLVQHRGTDKTKGGSHRTSRFRKLIGEALLQRGDFGSIPSWGAESTLAGAATKLGIEVEKLRIIEWPLEQAVSTYIGTMPFLWVDVPDAPSKHSERAIIECGSIALLSNWKRPELDPPSQTWLGHHSQRVNVRESGLWNKNCTDKIFHASFLAILERCAARTQPIGTV